MTEWTIIDERVRYAMFDGVGYIATKWHNDNWMVISSADTSVREIMTDERLQTWRPNQTVLDLILIEHQKIQVAGRTTKMIEDEAPKPTLVLSPAAWSNLVNDEPNLQFMTDEFMGMSVHVEHEAVQPVRIVDLPVEEIRAMRAEMIEKAHELTLLRSRYMSMVGAA